jgi:hypothetical protein
MRRLLGVLAVLAALVVAGSIAASDARVRPGKGIGRIDIGMTAAQVRARLGRPDAVRERRVGFGNRFLELQYDGALFTVGLLGRQGRMRVHSVGTMYRSERTPQGFGVGTPEAGLARAYGARLSCDRLRTLEGWSYVANRTRDCVLDRGRGAETVFVTSLPRDRPKVFIEPHEWRGLAEVLEIRVRKGALR